MFHDQSADLPMPSSDAAYSLPIQLAAKLRAGRRCSPAAAAAASRRGTHGTSMCVAPTATGSDSHKFSQLSLTQPSRYAALSSAASPSDHCSRLTLCSDPNEAVDIPALHALQPIDRAPGVSASLFHQSLFDESFSPQLSDHAVITQHTIRECLRQHCFFLAAPISRMGLSLCRGTSYQRRSSSAPRQRLCSRTSPGANAAACQTVGCR